MNSEAKQGTDKQVIMQMAKQEGLTMKLLGATSNLRKNTESIRHSSDIKTMPPIDTPVPIICTLANGIRAHNDLIEQAISEIEHVILELQI